MDTDLIEYCLDVLNAMDAKEKLVSEERGESNGNVMKIRLKRIVKVAVALIIILAFGKVFIVGEKESVVTVDIKSTLIEKGFDNVQLPTFFKKEKNSVIYINSETLKVNSQKFDSFEEPNGQKIGFLYKGKYCNLIVSNYYDFKSLVGFKKINEMVIKNLDIDIYNFNENYIVCYEYKGNYYKIWLPFSYNEVIEVIDAV